MKRRSTSGRKPARARQTAKPTHNSATKGLHNQRPSDLSQDTEVARLTRERDEALQQQAATSEVLRIIRRSPADTQPAFDAIVESAARLSGAIFSVVYLYDGDSMRIGATSNFSVEAMSRIQEMQELKRPERSHLAGRAILERAIIHVHDVLADPEYSRELALAGGWRAVLSIPLLRDGIPVGVLSVGKAEPRPFSDRQVLLLQTFADQAVIAIENARSFNDLRRRTTDLAEALEQQTATSKVLQVISSSPGELEPVFATMLEKAVRICDAKFGNIYRWDGEALRIAATYNTPPAFVEFRQRFPFRPDATSGTGRMLASKTTYHMADAAASQAYVEQRSPDTVAAVELGGVRTLLSVPLLKENELVGAFTLFRQEVRPFTDKQIELVENFAAQAVIAIENARLLNELRESLEQQTATADVLGVISGSPGELEPVFQTILRNATRICGANFGTFNLRDGEEFPVAATYNMPEAYVELRRRTPRPTINPKHPLGRVAATKQVVHISDLRAEDAYREGEPAWHVMADLAGARTLLVVPMLKEQDIIGAITIFRQEVRPFTDKQIALLQNFANQAVIAVENARLLNELRQRTDDLTESLEQQTATSEVLQVISGSPGKLQMVFQAMAEKAVRVCGATFGSIYRCDGAALQLVASHNPPPAYAETVRRLSGWGADAQSPLGRMIATKSTLHIIDATAEETYVKRTNPALVAAVELAGVRTVLCVPMLKEGVPVGGFTLSRQEVRPFSDKQIELVTNFAAQAVIAIENARLLDELRESLQQQTATADVLKVISSSPGDLEPVFAAILANGERLCEASFGVLALYEDGAFRVAATHNVPPAYAEYRSREPRVDPRPGTVAARMAATKDVVHIHDYAADMPDNPLVKLGGGRTSVAVPMLKEGELVGLIQIYRQEVRPFTDKQIELVKNFAAQAVIAIENARLLNELRQRTDELGRSVTELRALGEISQAVNSTLDLETVLSTIVAKAAQLSGTEAGAIYVFDELQREFHLRATFGMEQELIDAITHQHVDMRDPNVAAIMTQGEPIQVADLRDEVTTELNEITLHAGFRARLVAPLIGGEDVVGMLVVRRRAPGAFPQNTVELMKTFAAQSALAIQNARLFHEIEDKSRQLEVASQHKSQFLANMSHELRTPLNAILGYTELIADGAYGEPSEKMLEALKRLEVNGRHLLGLINDVLDLSKIEAGQLELELSDYSVWDIAQSVRSTLEPLAADKKLAFKVEVPAGLPPGHGDGRRLTQVLINLVGNAIKFTDAGEVAIKAEANNGAFYVSVRDTGPGISAADQTKLFQEFQQADNAITKKKGGTGLGLAISKRIIEMHGGRIWVESQPGQGSTFAFTLPVTVERQVGTA